MNRYALQRMAAAIDSSTSYSDVFEPEEVSRLLRDIADGLSPERCLSPLNIDYNGAPAPRGDEIVEEDDGDLDLNETNDWEHTP